jgi:hypothetical protein
VAVGLGVIVHREFFVDAQTPGQAQRSGQNLTATVDETGVTPSSNYPVWKRHWEVFGQIARELHARPEDLDKSTVIASINTALKARGEHWIVRPQDIPALRGPLAENVTLGTTGPNGGGLFIDHSPGFTMHNGTACGHVGGSVTNSQNVDVSGSQFTGSDNCPAPVPKKP